MEETEEKIKLHVYLMALGLISRYSEYSRSALELLLESDDYKYFLMFYPSKSDAKRIVSGREQHIKDVFHAHKLCYEHLLSLYVRDSTVIRDN